MIQTENVTINGRQFTRTWSDANKYVVRDGVSYSEAYDPSELNRTYTEGEDMSADEVNAEAEELLNILTGESE